MNKKEASALGAIYLITEALAIFAILYTLRRFQTIDVTANWLFLSSLIPIAPLLISGYGALITREIAKENHDASVATVIPTHLLRQSSHFLKMSLIIAMVFQVFTMIYCYSEKNVELVLSILVFSIAILSRVYMGVFFAYFIGLQRYGIDKAVMIFCSLFSLSLVFISAMSFTGLIYIVGAYCMPYLFGALFVRQKFRIINQSKSLQTSRPYSLCTTEVIKMYVINFAGFITLNTHIYIANYYFDRQTFIEVGVISKIILGLISVSSMAIALQAPSYSSTYASGDREKFNRLVLNGCMLSSVFVVVSGSTLILIYDQVLMTLISHQQTISNHVVTLWVIFALVSVNTMNVGMAVISSGDSALVKIAFPAAVAGLIAAIVGAHHYGAAGMIMGMALNGVICLAMHIMLLQRISGSHK